MYITPLYKSRAKKILHRERRKIVLVSGNIISSRGSESERKVEKSKKNIERQQAFEMKSSSLQHTYTVGLIRKQQLQSEQSLPPS